MRTFDDLCLTPIEEFTPQQIHDLGLREHASQAVFARYLNVTPSTVSQWERGEKRPRGPSMKLPTLVAHGRRRPSILDPAAHHGVVVRPRTQPA